MKNTIVFIHGMFQNPKSWEKWISYFSEKGYNCLAPAWPLHEGEPSYLRQNPPSDLGELELSDVVASIEEFILKLDEKPIVIGHSVGGLIVQLLANRNMIKAGVAISPVAPNGMLDFDWGFFKNAAIITNPLKGNEPIYTDLESFHESFCNTMTLEETKPYFEQYATHDSRNVLRGCMGEAGKIDLDIPHVPLLLIAAEKDQIIPPALTEKNTKAYTDTDSVTDYKEFTNRGHFICGQPGWEEIAVYSYDWLQRQPLQVTEAEGFYK